MRSPVHGDPYFLEKIKEILDASFHPTGYYSIIWKYMDESGKQNDNDRFIEIAIPGVEDGIEGYYSDPFVGIGRIRFYVNDSI